MSGTPDGMGAKNLAEVLDAIPHRYPFLMIDRIVEFEPDSHIVCLKNVTINEPFFQGHFPGEPVMPGVLLAEAMAQAGGVFVVRTLGPGAEGSLVYLMALDAVRFRRPVVPGDQVRIRAAKNRSRGNIWKIDAEAEVDGERVAECAVTAMIRTRA